MKPFLYAAILTLVQPLAACGDAVSTSDDPAATAGDGAGADGGATEDEYDHLVVAFGDSLYAGYNLDQDEGFAPALQRTLREDGLSVRVVNAGVSGDTTAAGRERLAFTLDGLDRAPDLVLLGLGGNDMLRGISPEQTRANLTAMLEELDRRGIEVVLTGMLAAPNLGRDYAADFNPIYGDLAQQFGVTLYPFFLDDVIQQRELMLADGIHPNSEGIAVVVENIAPLVVAAIGDE